MLDCDDGRLLGHFHEGGADYEARDVTEIAASGTRRFTQSTTRCTSSALRSAPMTPDPLDAGMSADCRPSVTASSSRQARAAPIPPSLEKAIVHGPSAGIATAAPSEHPPRASEPSNSTNEPALVLIVPHIQFYTKTVASTWIHR